MLVCCNLFPSSNNPSNYSKEFFLQAIQKILNILLCSSSYNKMQKCVYNTMINVNNIFFDQIWF